MNGPEPAPEVVPEIQFDTVMGRWHGWPVTPHCWAAVLISCVALGFALAALGCALVVMLR